MENKILKIIAVLKTLRIHQWTKNFLVFLPLVCSHSFNQESLFAALTGFFCLCLTASSVYILNDILDIEDDKKDPEKKYRPIPSQIISIKTAIKVMLFLYFVVIVLSYYLLNINAICVLALYFVITSLYSCKLKTIPIADIYVLSALYSIRVLFGNAVTNINLSAWLIVFCMFFFLSLACIKRVSELYKAKINNFEPSKRRGYKIEDLNILTSFGVGCSLISVLVIGLYINSEQVKILYKSPNKLWVIVFMLLFWNMRIWFLGVNGKVNRDPVVFVTKDFVSYMVMLLAGLTILLAF